MEAAGMEVEDDTADVEEQPVVHRRTPPSNNKKHYNPLQQVRKRVNNLMKPKLPCDVTRDSGRRTPVMSDPIALAVQWQLIQRTISYVLVSE